MRKASKAWSVDRILIVTEECWFVCSCLFFSGGLLKLDFNDTLLSSTHTLPAKIFNLKEGETMLTRDNENFSNSGENRTCDPPVQCLERPIFIVFRGSRVRFSPGVLKFPLSRVSMVSPSFKLKMFTGSVCVLLARVSLKFIEIKIKLIYATTSSWEKKQNGGWKVSDGDWFYFSFYDLSWFFDDPSWSESNVILFLFFVRSELIRVDPTQTGGPSWSSPTFLPASFTTPWTQQNIWKQANLKTSTHMVFTT